MNITAGCQIKGAPSQLTGAVSLVIPVRGVGYSLRAERLDHFIWLPEAFEEKGKVSLFPAAHPWRMYFGETLGDSQD